MAESEETLPTIDFTTFILSLSHSALMHLGEAPHPETNATATDLAMAKQTIDLVALMEEKTKGNLTGNEERILGEVLFDLRVRFVQAQKRHP